MANELGRVQVIMSGFTGAPGLMYFAFQGSTPGTFTNADATAAIAAVRAFLVGSNRAWWTGVSLQVQSAVEVVDWVTGALLHVAAGTGVLVTAGSATAPPNVASGPLAQLYTNTVIGRRLLRGRLFLTPSGANTLTAAGTVDPLCVTAVQAAGAALIALGTVTWSVWHRPNPYKTGNNGTVGAVVNVICPTKVAVLRSRRD